MLRPERKIKDRDAFFPPRAIVRIKSCTTCGDTGAVLIDGDIRPCPYCCPDAALKYSTREDNA